jgi:hypothetical protein
VDADYGVDFWCQVLRPTGKRATEETTGAILAVQVKATEGKARPRVKLDRRDAVDLLRQTHATALIAVRPEIHSVHFVFMDEPLIDRLSHFLASDAKTHSIRLDELTTSVAEFDRRLLDFTRTGTQHRLRLYKAESAIGAAAPGSSVSVHESSTGGFALVDVPWFGSALEVDPAERESVRVQVFEQGRPPENMQGISVKSAFLQVRDLVDGPVFVQGLAEAHVEVMLEYEGQRASAIFGLRRVGDERAYTHAVGLSLVISDPKKQGNRWVHELHSRVFLGEQSLGEAGDIMPFLRLLRSGATMSLDGKEFGPVERIGSVIARIGPAVEALQKIADLVDLDLKEFHLSDFGVEEFWYSVGFLDAFLLQKIPTNRLVPGFVVGASAERNASQLPTEPVRMDIPIVFNLKDRGAIVWVQALGQAFLTVDGRWCGFRIDEQLAWSFEAHARFEKSIYPEAWIFRYWPPVLIGKENRGSRDCELKAPEYFKVEADVTKETDPKGQLPLEQEQS